MEIQKAVEFPVEGKIGKRINSNALQQILAFASLIVLIVIFQLLHLIFCNLITL